MALLFLLPSLVLAQDGFLARRAAEETCCPGLSFTADDGCNTCTCPDSGEKTAAVCTYMSCPPSLKLTDHCVPLVAYPAGDGLNTCTCPWSGLKSEATCTTYACSQEPTLVTQPPDTATGGEGSCCPGLLIPAMDGCNTCLCPSSGEKNEAECTHASCPTWAQPPDTEECLALAPYPAGDGLNICSCPASGQKSEAVCTQLSCPATAPEESTTAAPEATGTCCPGVLFPAPDGCNICTCGATGLMQDSSCTQTACTAPAELMPEGHCMPFMAYPKGDGTNTCTCPQSGLKSHATCTHLTCAVAPVSEKVNYP